MRWLSAIRRLFGRRPEISAPTVRLIRAGYDAAGAGNETTRLWTAADSLDADQANSLAIRQKLRARARYERANNGHCAGIIATHANYVIGTGPRLRMQTNSAAFNAMVEAAWNRWAAAAQFAKKLRCMSMAKTCDGEVFCVLQTNPRLADSVSLDLALIECDQVTTPTYAGWDRPRYVDGIQFDEFGNAISYDILLAHPGSNSSDSQRYKTWPAELVVHWFRADRPGQHRGIPEITSTLNLFGTGRRYREAVVAAAETAADFSVILQMPVANDGPDEARPFTSVPIEKRMMIATPAGATASQMKAEHPSTTYVDLLRALICEEARPLGMPYNIAACDSSGYSFSGGRLDHQTYFVGVGVERDDCETLVLNRVFAAWFAEATSKNYWTGDGTAPRHAWDWPAMPQIDPQKTASARETSLRTGTARLGSIYAEDGLDFEDELTAMAAEYGVSVDEMRGILRAAVFSKPSTAPAQPGDSRTSDEDQGDDGEPVRANGNGRFAIR